MAQLLTSPSNARLKLIRRLASRRGRVRESAFAVEGEDLLEAGLDAGWVPRYVLAAREPTATPSAAQLSQLLHRVPEGRLAIVEAELLGRVAELAHPPRVLSIFDLPEDVRFDAPGKRAATCRLYLDGLRDPGNVGTAIRSAYAFGLDTVFVGPGTADPFGPKAARASMGAIFHVDCVQLDDFSETVEEGQLVVALTADAATDIQEVDLGERPLLCIGSEREGLSEAVLARADARARIPQMPGADSLNAGVAASIALYEWSRQQQARDRL